MNTPALAIILGHFYFLFGMLTPITYLKYANAAVGAGFIIIGVVSGLRRRKVTP